MLKSKSKSEIRSYLEFEDIAKVKSAAELRMLGSFLLLPLKEIACSLPGYVWCPLTAKVFQKNKV